MDKTLEAFSAMQRPDDGFGSWGTVNSESCAQDIVVLTAPGIDLATDSDFVKKGSTALGALTVALLTAAFELKCKEREA